MATTLDAAVAEAATITNPLARLVAATTAARRVDVARSTLAAVKGEAALACAAAGITQRAMAAACDVQPAMVQQWVRRGRETVTTAT